MRAIAPRCLGLAVLALSCAWIAPAFASQTRGLTLGFTDPVFMDNVAAPDWFARAGASGASIARLDTTWASLAPSRPVEPTSPDDPAYRWTVLDTAVKEAAAAGVTPVVDVEHAPPWAEGPAMPASATPGTWKPSPAAFGQFAQALAARYDGSHPDPQAPGTALPTVHFFQGWNEPNLDVHYAPQWVRTQHGWAPYAAAGYRTLLNAFYAGIKAGDPSAQVVAAGAGPFGDTAPGGHRTPPAQFWRAVLCFKNRRLDPAPCPRPARFDIFDHHPYSVGDPYRKALNPDDVTIPDFAKLLVPLRRAESSGRALPRRRHRVWASEVSWDSNPPDPEGVPDKTRAVWIPETFQELWSEGVDTIFWYLVRDAAPVPSYAATYQSGMYLRDGTPKLSQQAFRFPVVRRRVKGHTIVWARLPQNGTVLIQKRVGSAWQTIRSRTGGLGDVVHGRFALAPGVAVRVLLQNAP